MDHGHSDEISSSFSPEERTEIRQPDGHSRRPVSLYDDKRLKGARIGCSEFLLVAESKKTGWSFRLLSLWGDGEWLTGWIHLKQPEDLRTARQAKIIHDELRREYADETDSLLDRAIGVFQDRAELFHVTADQTHPYAGDANSSDDQVPWPDPGEPNSSYGRLENLYVEIRDYLREHLDLPDERYYDLVACWVLASWRQRDFETSPYLFFLGPVSSGKTRALECLWQLCYRGMLVSSISPAALFRAVHAYQPTLLIDESELYSRETLTEVLAILNAGYRRGQVVVRVVNVSNGEPRLGRFET